jgi:glycosyltransferase involved in cell wall biosynthesis
MPETPRAPVTAVIPVYNRAHLVEQTVASVRQQTLAVSEIVCVDNNSTDNSLEVLHRLAAATTPDQPPIVVVQESTQGVGHARNRGIATATQPWIAFLDSDDRWVPEKIAKQFALIDATPSLRFLAHDYARERDGVIEPRHRPGYGGGDVYVPMWFGGWVGTPSVLVHREALDAVSGDAGAGQAFDGSFELSEDYELWLRLAARFALGYLNENLAIVAVHGQNISYANELAGRMAFLRILEKNYDPARIPLGRARERIAYIHRKCAAHWRRMGERTRALAHLREAASLHPWSPRIFAERIQAWLLNDRSGQNWGRHIEREVNLLTWWRPGAQSA